MLQRPWFMRGTAVEGVAAMNSVKAPACRQKRCHRIGRDLSVGRSIRTREHYHMRSGVGSTVPLPR